MYENKVYSKEQGKFFPVNRIFYDDYFPYDLQGRIFTQDD